MENLVRSAVALPLLAATLLWPAAGRAAERVTTAAYRESNESFTWELDWDGTASGADEEFTPLRADPTLPELWSPSLRLGAAKGFRALFRARHNGRAHDLDAPQGSLYQAVFRQKQNLTGPDEWTRVLLGEAPHLQTPKDHKDQYDLLARTRTDAQGRKVYRLVFQGTHGPPAKAKKVKKQSKKRAD